MIPVCFGKWNFCRRKQNAVKELKSNLGSPAGKKREKNLGGYRNHSIVKFDACARPFDMMHQEWACAFCASIKTGLSLAVCVCPCLFFWNTPASEVME